MYPYLVTYGYFYPQSKLIVICGVKFCENLRIVKSLLQNVLPL